tara:strand:+ start:100 stop:525 length:426 start_codon:yes stop_codon:yes gene_type:complete
MSKTPFPQADKLDKILKLVRSFEAYSQKDLMSLLELGTPRQLQYYLSAAMFLGFITSSRTKTELTASGRRVLQESNDFFKERFILELLKNSLIKSIVFNYKEKTIREVLESYDNFRPLSDSTKKRRIETIQKWVEWLNKNI